MFRVSIRPEVRPFALFFLRRAEAAFAAYYSALSSLKEYIEAEPNTISLYFRALSQFETCISRTWQAFDQYRRFEIQVLERDRKIFTKGDGSTYERLNKMYNIDRHVGGHVSDEAFLPIWLTNTGLAADGFNLTYTELSELLSEAGDFAERISHPDPANLPRDK